MGARLPYFSGSPFARMARVLIDEWALPVATEEWKFPPDPALWDLTPAGQVPVLIEPDRPALFPTLLILERLWDMAGHPPDAYDPAADRQALLATLQAGDALVTAFYIGWTGLREVATNHIGYGLGERQLHRFGSVLDWLETRADAGDLRGGVTLPGVALACLVLWADARDGYPWRGRPGIEAVVDSLAARPSFSSTLPRVWAPER